MIQQLQDVPRFDSVTELKSAEEYLSVSEKCHPLTTVVIHVYEQVGQAVGLN